MKALSKALKASDSHNCTPKRFLSVEIWRHATFGTIDQATSLRPLLRKLRAPTLIVGALDDIFFGVQWAQR